MEFREKKQRLIDGLEEAKISQVFRITSESEDSVLFQGEQDMGGTRCIISLEIDNHPCACIHYCVGKLKNISRKDAMIELLNKFNEDNMLVTFYLNEDNSVMSRVTYIAFDERFDGNEYIQLLRAGYNIIEDNYYPKIMKILWG